MSAIPFIPVLFLGHQNTSLPDGRLIFSDGTFVQGKQYVGPYQGRISCVLGDSYGIAVLAATDSGLILLPAEDGIALRRGRLCQDIPDGLNALSCRVSSF